MGAASKAPVRRHTQADTDAEELYASLGPLLVLVAVRRFRVPADEAEALMQDVFVSYIRRHPAVRELRAWFIGAICQACRHYWRKQARFVPLDEAATATRSFEPRAIARLTMWALLRRLKGREAQVLSLRFEKGCTIHEIALSLGISPKRAEKVLRRALHRLAATHTPAADADEIHWITHRSLTLRTDAHPRLHASRGLKRSH